MRPMRAAAAALWSAWLLWSFTVRVTGAGGGGGQPDLDSVLRIFYAKYGR